MIQNYTSGNYKSLITALARNIKNSSNGVFESEIIVGATGLTQQYIKEHIAYENGIAANIDFLSVPQFFQKLFYLLKPATYSFRLVSDIKAIQLVYQVLENEVFLREHPFISTYYLNNEQKRYGLARKVQALFAKYAYHAPNYLEAWIDDETIQSVDDELWQADLWRLYREKLRELKLYDSFDSYSALKDAIYHADVNLKEIALKIPSIHLVRVEDLSGAQVEILERLQEHIAITSYQTYGLIEGSALYEQWSLGGVEFEKAATTALSSPVKLSSKARLLKQLQFSIVNTEEIVFSKDDSLEIHGHFTVYREVEGLFNYIIHQSQLNQGELTAKDIVVYCCNLKEYIPAIHYFFNKQDYRIPYRILGEKELNTKSSVDALREIIQLDSVQMNPNEVMRILEFPSIKDRFKLNDLEAIKRWIDKATIRYGYIGDLEDETNVISWKNGLDRILFGSCIGKEVGYKETTTTLDLTEASSFEEFINFRYFIEKLHRFKEDTAVSNSIDSWINYTKELINFFFNIEHDEALQKLLEQIGELQTLDETLISFKEWRLFLIPLIKEPHEHRKTNPYGITFVELSQSQVIPCRTSAVLGLNYDSFPLAENPLDFDLLKSRVETKTNLNRKQRDKNVFLNILLQTHENVYLSYLSHSPKDNTEIPASIVVEQLLDFINNKGSVLDVIHHPLHGFNSKYNIHDGLISYSINEASDTLNFNRKEALESEEKLKKLNFRIQQFISFFIDSFKYYNQLELGLYHNDREEELCENELFSLDALQEWYLKNWVVQNGIDPSMLDKEELETVFMNFKVEGRLPLNALGEYHFNKTLHGYKDVLEDFFQELEGLERRSIDLNINYEIEEEELVLEGRVDVYEETYYSVCVTGSIGKNKWSWLIMSYFLFLENKIANTVFIYQDKKSFHKLTLTREELYASLDHQKVKELISLFLEGHQRLVPVYLSKDCKEYDALEKFKESLYQDDYLSEFVSREIKKPYFLDDPIHFEAFYNNYNLISKIIQQNN